MHVLLVVSVKMFNGNNEITDLTLSVGEGDEKQRFVAILADLKDRVGEKKWGRESVRSKCISIASLMIDLERDVNGQLNGVTGKLVSTSGTTGRRVVTYRQGDPERTIHVSAQISSLLKTLGLRDDD